MSVKLTLKDFRDYSITSIFASDYANDGQRKTLKINVFVLSHVNYEVSHRKCNYLYGNIKNAIKKFNEL